MAHFARIDANSIVEDVLVVEQDFINTGALGDPAMWIQTSYNTRGGIYYIPNSDIPDPDQSKALRKNYAGVGFTYDVQRDAFIAPQPYPSWILNEFSCTWESPVPMPDDGNAYVWNEETQSWDLLPL